jgi:acyl transferase domain-containing protein/NADPH:quinone reductase-like Zn-dependent oxidoreductase
MGIGKRLTSDKPDKHIGQGAQWAGMGAGLFALHPFSNSIHRQDEILRRLSDSPSWRLKDVLNGSASASIQDAIVSQTACTALQIALVDLLRYWGVSPSACIGHSSGEIAAAYASGKISLAEATMTAYYRGYALATNSRRGSMLAVGMTDDSARELISGMEGEVKIAAINSPSSVTLSGNVAEITRLETELKQKNVFARILRTGDNAYHSHHMTAVGITYEALLLRGLAAVADKTQIPINPAPMDATWISSVSPDKQDFFVDLKVTYWRKNLELPVQFLRAVENMLSGDAEAPNVIIEIGPHATLRSPLHAIFAQVQATKGFKIPTYLSALRRHENGSRNILELCGNLFCLNHTVNLQKVNTARLLAGDETQNIRGQVSTELPPYRYNYADPVHHESRIFREIRDRRYLHHDMLGVLQPGCAKDRPSWRNVLRLKDIPWLADHRLIPQIIFPAASYIALATEALAQYHHRTVTGQEAPIFRLRNVSIKTPMEIPNVDEGVEIMVHLQVMTPGSPWHSFLVSSESKVSKAWTEHASGLVAIHSDAQQRLKIPEGLSTPHYLEAKEWYEKFFQCGLGYGPSFQGLSNLCCYPVASVTTATVGMNTTRDMFNGPESRYCIHPCTLDSCFQLLPIAAHGGQTKSLQSAFVPIGIEELTIWPSADEGSHARAVAFARRAGLRGGRGDIQLFSQDGKPRVEVVNMQCVQYQGGPAIDNLTQVSANPYSQLIWKPDISTLTKENATAMFSAAMSSYDHRKGSSYFEMRRVLDLLSHKNPSMKVIGVGTDSRSVTEAALEVLGGATPASRKFSKYIYTDHAIQMDQSMQKAMARCKDISHQPLAIQDFSNKKTVHGEYDLVIARANHELGSNNLDAFRSIRQLLGRGGHLLVVEAIGSSEEWNHTLKLSNFEGVDLHLDDDQLPLQTTRTILATASLSASLDINQNPDQLLLVITDSLEDRFATALVSAAINAGVHAELITFKDADIRSGSRVILTARPNHHPLLHGSESEFQALKNIISHSSSLLFLADGDVLRGSNPQAAVLTGLVRMLVTEDAASRFGILHMEEGYSMSDSALLQAVLHRESDLHDYSGRNESEVAMFNGIAYIPRLLAHAEMNDKYHELNPEKLNIVERSLSNREPLQLDFELPGVLSSQYFRPNTSFDEPLPETWIEIEVRSAGLNWKDIAAVTGKVDLDHFSHECSGIVLACGASVHEFSTGDRVYGVALSRFGNIVRAPAGFLQLMPDDSTFSEMATMPVAFVSVLFSLLHLGRLEKGQRVLIQSAAGGVGLAAIQMARHAGAMIYATVGTREKIEYLVDYCNIPRHCIFESRSTKEISRMISETGGKGFDVILSSSSGNSMQEATQCLARRGIFIDLAREDVMKHHMMPMDFFARSATFTSFDLDDIAMHEPEFLMR